MEENKQIGNQNNDKGKRKIIVPTVVVLAIIIAVAVIYFVSSSSVERINYNTNGYVELGKYKGLETNRIEAEVSEEEVTFAISKALEENKVAIPKDTVEDGVTVNIDYIGTKDGEAFPGGTAENSERGIGSGSFIDGFESGLIGCKKGDKVVLELTFPKNYNSEELAGQDVEFEVQINDIFVYEHPVLNDEFAKKMGFETVEKYEESMRTYLEEEDILKKEYDEKVRLLKIILADSEIIEYPQEQINAVKEEIVTQFEDDAKKQNIPFEDYVVQALQMEMDTFYKEVEKSAEQTIDEELIVYAIAQKENITVTEKEYDKYVQETLMAQGVDEEGFKELTNGVGFEEYYGKDSIYFALYIDKVLAKVIELGK